jgi:hypothetical protein
MRTLVAPLALQESPQEGCRTGAVRRPAPAEPPHLLGARQRRPCPRCLHRLPYPEVAGGKYVGTPKLVDEEHLRRPQADPSSRGRSPILVEAGSTAGTTRQQLGAHVRQCRAPDVRGHRSNDGVPLPDGPRWWACGRSNRCRAPAPGSRVVEVERDHGYGLRRSRWVNPPPQREWCSTASPRAATYCIRA